MYTWNFDDEGLWTNGEFTTVEGCIEEAKEYLEDNEYESFDHIYVAEIYEYVPKISISDCENMLDNLMENADYVCGEPAENWFAYDYLEEKALRELRDNVTNVVNNWLKKYNHYPDLYYLKNIKSYPIRKD